MISLHSVGDVVGGSIAGASVVFRLLPPPEKFNDWPRLQSGYKLFYVVIQWVAFNK
jgi:hypothetical protein